MNYTIKIEWRAIRPREDYYSIYKKAGEPTIKDGCLTFKHGIGVRFFPLTSMRDWWVRKNG